MKPKDTPTGRLGGLRLRDVKTGRKKERKLALTRAAICTVCLSMCSPDLSSQDSQPLTIARLEGWAMFAVGSRAAEEPAFLHPSPAPGHQPHPFPSPQASSQPTVASSSSHLGNDWRLGSGPFLLERRHGTHSTLMKWQTSPEMKTS